MKLPDKWTDYTTFGEIIPGTNIIVTKTPLKEEYFAQADEPVEHFTPEILKQKLEEKFNKRVGLVIDLTFTNKYYHALDICKIAGDYYKLTVEGQEIPAEAYVQQFIRVIDSFNKFIKDGGDPDQFNIDEDEPQLDAVQKEQPNTAEQTENTIEQSDDTPSAESKDQVTNADTATIGDTTAADMAAAESDQKKKDDQRIEREKDRLFSRFYPKNLPNISDCVSTALSAAEIDSYSSEMIASDFVIVVHCTHGVNRSGYMVARYLIDRFGSSPTEAIQRITEARGKGFDRENYIRVLMDSEIREMARLQMHYTYLADKQKYFQYVPGMRFRNRAFSTWKKTAKRKADAAKEDPTQPDTKILKITADEVAESAMNEQASS